MKNFLLSLHVTAIRAVLRALISVGKKDIQEMIDDGKPIEVNCHFCNKNYTFDVDELKDILEKARG